MTDDFNYRYYREVMVEMKVADGATWYEAERTVKVEEAEAMLDRKPWACVWLLTGPCDEHYFTEYLELRPQYYGA